jgi:hypothetical protein
MIDRFRGFRRNNVTVCDTVFRMRDALSQAGKMLAAERWQATRPIRLSRELVERAAELPEAERDRLRRALQEVGNTQ